MHQFFNQFFGSCYISVQPLLIRQVRAELTQKAEHAAIEVFAVNLKKLLLSPPFRGKVVLGIDPGNKDIFLS